MTCALVTGGTGFIGSHVVRVLLKQNIPVRCLVREGSNRANLSDLDIEFAVGDLQDSVSLKRAVQGCDSLFHVAADYRLWTPDPQEMHRTNVEGSRSLLQAAAEAGLKKIIYTSSVAAVGRPSPPPSPQTSGGRAVAGPGEGSVGHEGLDPSPSQLIGPYKKSKFDSELVARDFAKKGLPVIIVNPSTPIGSHDIKPTPTGKLIVDFLNGKMPGYVDTGLNFVDVEDVAVGHWLAYQKGKVGERYILGHENLTLKNFLEKVAQVAKRPAPRFQIPYALAYAAGAVSTGLSYLTRKEPAIALDGVRMAHEPMYYDASKAIRELGLPQTKLETAIQKAVEWFQANGYAR